MQRLVMGLVIVLAVGGMSGASFADTPKAPPPKPPVTGTAKPTPPPSDPFGGIKGESKDDTHKGGIE